MGVPILFTASESVQQRVENQIKRFRRTYRRRLRRLAARTERLSDLIVSFPAAAFALATLYGTPAMRRVAIDRVKSGEPLKRVAEALDLPYWTRKLPPEAFATDLPQRLPGDPKFGARLIGQIPANAEHIAPWFLAVVESEATCDETFALWMAAHGSALPPGHWHACSVRIIALYAWFSERPETEAGALVQQRFNERMGLRRATQGAAEWWHAVRRELYLGSDGVSDPWLSGGRAAGYRIVPLLTLSELEREGEAMSNCVTDYAWHMARDQCRLFSIRRGSTHIATMEIRPHEMHDGKPHIAQLYGPDNEDAPDRVWAAAYTWLGKQGRFELPQYQEGDPAPSAAAWQRLWKPYWREKGVREFLPELPETNTVTTLSGYLSQLQRAAR